MSLDTNQQKCLMYASKGHNILITGRPGTGKSFVLVKIARFLKKQGKTIKVTATTGMAARALRIHFKETFTVSTIHKLMGIKDGRHENDEILGSVNGKREFTKNSIRGTPGKWNVLTKTQNLKPKILKSPIRNSYLSHQNQCLKDNLTESIEKVYVAEDTGSPDALQRCRLPKKIHLKINSLVILLVNLSDELVNGLVGIVTDLKQDSVTVHFDSLERNFEMKKHMFPIYDIKLKKDIACRSQIPLKLAFALTVHRAQGLTLNRVHVHCRYMLQPGQVAVAFSRVRMKKDLRVSDFSEKVVVKPPAENEEFYCQIQALKKPDLKCCRNFELEEMETETSSESSYQPGETDEIS
ncbi:hypothetical protein KUTeg_010825 [Tegillarca granosa]|uniref:DNA helicase n=1 Tax=Tegillarca granosa TaxID=220873 RepID=A0ABQ9F5F3_TEGGR|nr:hypothetical protein KUTeg_010825 [Tegillarca granosa]